MNKARYFDFCDEAPDLPLFMQGWYLDAVCKEGSWQAVAVSEAGRVIGVMPYYLKRKWGMSYVAMPRLCKFMGPYLLPEYRNPDAETKYYEKLLNQLPAGLAAFEQDTCPDLVNWLPFYWNGFRQTTRYTYALDLSRSESDIYRGVSGNYRKKINKAREKVRVIPTDDLEAVYRTCMLSFRRKNLALPFDFEFLKGLADAARMRNAAQGFLAQDLSTGEIHSANFLVWDKTTAWYLLGGDDPALRSSGSGVLLQWEALRYAKNQLQLQLFDFEGSMIREIEAGRREFGAFQRPYFRLQKEWSTLWRWAKIFRSRGN